MSQVIADQKRALRLHIRECQQPFSPEARVKASLALCEQLRRQAVWQDAQCILLFSPLSDEPDIRPLLEEALSSRKVVALPRYDSQRREYEVCQVSSLADLRLAHFGIMEPKPDLPALKLNRLDFVLVPGVAFDATGRRLGRGKGYFDRLLAKVQGHKCGVAFEWQVVPAVPVDEHDVFLNSLLTPSRWLRSSG